MGKASTLAKHSRLPTWRPLAPATLVLTSALALIAGRRWRRIAVPAVHACAAAVAAERLSIGQVRRRDVFLAIQICHWAYGLGFWRGASRHVRRLPFDSRPSGHR
jgi:hypothetical protein